MSDFKLEAAQKAFACLTQCKFVGLGAGSTVEHLVRIIGDHHESLSMTFVTSSPQTLALLKKYMLPVATLQTVCEIDICVDGCDQMDYHLNALKSGGGIHTREKILASMALEFILIGDEGKRVPQFDGKYPVVLEVLPEALHLVTQKVPLLYPQSRLHLRQSLQGNSPEMTQNGNYLLEVWFTTWPNILELDTGLKLITGVVETSLFFQLAHKAILAGNSGVRVYERARNPGVIQD